MSENALAPTTVKGMLSDPRVEAQIRNALPAHMDAKRMMRIALSSVARNPKLAACTPNSVGVSLIRAAEFGVEVNGWEAHLVPYKNKGVMECQLIVDYKGLCKLAYQSELVLEIHAEVVRYGDMFEWCKGTDSYLRWKPKEDGEGNRKMTHAWASAKIKNGGCPFVVLTREEVMQHKRCSTAANSEFSPWNRPETEPAMWKKTAIRELCKTLPRSSALTQLLMHETAMEIGGDVIEGVLVQPSNIEEVPDPETTKSDALAEAAKKRRGRPPKQQEQPAEQPPEEQEQPAGETTEPQMWFDGAIRRITQCHSILELMPLASSVTNDPMRERMTAEQQEQLANAVLEAQARLE